MRDSDALYNFTPNICSNIEPKVSNWINGGKYIPTRIQFMVKNESVLIQEDADTNISQNKIKDNNLDLRFGTNHSNFLVHLTTQKLKMRTNTHLTFTLQIENHIELGVLLKRSLITSFNRLREWHQRKESREEVNNSLLIPFFSSKFIFQ